MAPSTLATTAAMVMPGPVLQMRRWIWTWRCSSAGSGASWASLPLVTLVMAAIRAEQQLAISQFQARAHFPLQVVVAVGLAVLQPPCRSNRGVCQLPSAHRVSFTPLPALHWPTLVLLCTLRL